MTLSAGARLGPYEILSPLGAGGMGEVYRARDSKLRREVAVKVLPASFSGDPERLARFEREAQLLASLNHPNIGAIYGLEESEGVRYLVLELVPGETLAERLAAGPLATEQALEISRQIAEALEAAHEKGIVHRDLKPANVKVTPEGKVKVLDFGLAKAFAAEGPAADLSRSPTVTTGGTREGVILGTAAYMSPEQARGKSLDKRTDIWSFGCVLYEALTGRKAFVGETVSDTIAAILKQEPDWKAVPENTPPNIRSLLRRCLQKDPSSRLRDIGDARIEIEEAFAQPLSVAATAAAAFGRPRPSRRAKAALWSLAALTMLAAGAALWSWIRPRPSPPQPVTRLVIPLPASAPLAAPYTPSLALSPDGTRLVYVAGKGADFRLYLRQMDRLEATEIPGTEGGFNPFFSPDGEWVGFFTPDNLMKVSLRGGAPVRLCAAEWSFGASWGADDTIYFAPIPAGGLFRVSASGGVPQAVTTLDPKTRELNHLWPEVLPGGKALLFTAWTEKGLDEARIEVLSLKSGKRRTLAKGGSNPHYAATGHLVFARAGSLMGAPFDLDRLELTGPPITVLEGVRGDPFRGGTQYTLSQTGVMVYVPGGYSAAARALVWVDRRGGAQPLTETRQAYYDPRFSPDGKRLAIGIEGANHDIWLYELAQGTLTRLTFGPNWDGHAIWTPDGKHVTFASAAPGNPDLFGVPSDGSRESERLLPSEYTHFPSSWSPDGKVLAFEELHPGTGFDIWMLPVEGERKPRPFLRTPFEEAEPRFSPDGRHIAYTSDESRRREVYVQPYPGPGGKRQISTEGGAEPVWRPDGRELFYRNGSKMMAVSIETKPEFEAKPPRLLFEGNYEIVPLVGADYDVTPDGERFVMLAGDPQGAVTQLHVVLNWFEELKRRVPPAKNQ